jgi:hypothetical protein
MSKAMNTCGNCRHGVPCADLYNKRSRIDAMAGFLACEIQQNTAEDRAKYLSPVRGACRLFKKKDELPMEVV